MPIHELDRILSRLFGLISRCRSFWLREVGCVLMFTLLVAGQAFGACSISFSTIEGGAVTEANGEYKYVFSSTDYAECDPGKVFGIYVDAAGGKQNLGGARSYPVTSNLGATVWIMSAGAVNADEDAFYYIPVAGVSGTDTFVFDDYNDITHTVTVTVPATVPVISSISPSVGGIAGGTSVTLNGSNLAEATSVKFGTTTALAITANSATSITVTSPSHAAGVVDISVTTAQGSNINSVADNYTYVTPVTAMPVAATVGHGTSSNSITLSLSGGAATSVAVATAPTHGTASATGTAISYTPTGTYSGSDSFTYTATNAAGTSSAATVTITVSPPTLAIIPPSGTALSAVTTGPYTQTFVAASGSSPYTYALAVNTGSLPSGFSFNSATGVLSGTPSTTGVVSFTVTATDSSTGDSTFSVTGSYLLTVSAVPTGTLTFSTPGAASVTLGANLPNAATSTVSGADKGVISYSSSDNTVATVDGSGVITTLSAGTTVITATQAAVAGKNAQATQSYTLTVTSLPVGTVSFAAPGSASVIIGGSLTNAATSTLSGGSYGTISYHSSAPGVATVNGSGVITSVSVGSTVITATQAAVNGVNALAAQSYTLTVNPLPTPTLTFATAGSASVALGHTLSNSASSTLSGGGYGAISYSSSDTSVATINTSTGLVIPVSAGTAIITATQAATAANAVASQSYSLTVSALPVGTVSFVTPGSSSVMMGGLLNNPASSTLSGGSYGHISYSSSNTLVATVNSSGVVTPVSAGTATITATQAATAANAVASQSYSLTVSALPVGTVSFVTPGSSSVMMGGLLNNPASSTLSGGSYGLISYSSSNTAVATVNSSGVVTPVSVGSSVITATQAAVGGVNALASQSYTLTVGVSSTSVTLTSSVPVLMPGQSVTLTATITPGSATGSVHFMDGSNSLGHVVVSSGHASLVLASLSVGSHALTAAYSGDGSTAAATSAVTTVVVGQRSDPTTNAAVRQSVTTQMAMAQRFSQVQLTNVYSHMQLLHGDFTIQNRFGLELNSPKLNELRAVGNALYDNFSKPVRNQSGTETRVASAGDLPDLSGFPQVKSKVARKLPMQELTALEEDSEQQSESDTDVLHIGGIPTAIWSAGSIDIGSMDGIDGNRTRFNSTGLTVGMDMQWSRNLIFGMSLGYAQGSTTMDTMGSDTQSRWWSSSLYATYRPAKKWFIDALVGMGAMGYDNHRWDDQSSLLLSGNRRGTVAYGSFSVTREMEIEQFHVHPFGRFDLSKTMLNRYSEHGSAMALTYNDTSYTTTSFAGGLEIFKDFSLASGQLTPSIKLQVTHRPRGDASQTIYYTDMGANSTNYTMLASSGIPEDLQSFGVGLNFKNHHGVQTNLSWLGSIGGNAYRSNIFRLDVRMGF